MQESWKVLYHLLTKEAYNEGDISLKTSSGSLQTAANQHRLGVQVSLLILDHIRFEIA